MNTLTMNFVSVMPAASMPTIRECTTSVTSRGRARPNRLLKMVANRHPSRLRNDAQVSTLPTQSAFALDIAGSALASSIYVQ